MSILLNTKYEKLEVVYSLFQNTKLLGSLYIQHTTYQLTKEVTRSYYIYFFTTFRKEIYDLNS
jgi:hypothetical protein